MKKCIIYMAILSLLLAGCVAQPVPAQIAATTYPVYEFTSRLCQGTGITVTRLVTESVSCLHDYTLQVGQMRAIESAELLVINGAGLEEFLQDALAHKENVVDSALDIPLICPEDEDNHEHLDHQDHSHHHEEDPHIWLSPVHAAQMAVNICAGLSQQYPLHRDQFQNNLTDLLADLSALQAYGESQLADLSCRELVTFHDGFSYFAECFGLTILEAVEEESGSEASAAELIRLIGIVENHHLPAIFTEINGSDSAAAIISAETGAAVYTLDMAMSGSYFETMYRNIDTIKEALE